MKEKEYTHESFGKIVLGKAIGHKRALYGSNIKHGNTFKIAIHTSNLKRHLNTDWHHMGKQLIEVELSHSQFGEFITSAGMGEGVPCTIKSINRKRLKSPEFESKFEIIGNEFKDRIDKVDEIKTIATNRITELMSKKKALTKSEKSEITGLMRKINTEIDSNLPYMLECFQETAQDTIDQFKGEVNAYLQAKIQETGLTELQNKSFKLIEDKE